MNQLDRMRRKLKFTQADLAELTGMDQSRISVMLNTPLLDHQMKTIYRIANAMNCEVQILILERPSHD